ncbi:helix-turn-helix domain-containing protein [Enterococcus sp. AZ072]|uniref:helix-turn-helix domain-containing protein n=1 Tax=unclassified Enterococcus TaxID=2608891 RepID=UPI003D2864F1
MNVREMLKLETKRRLHLVELLYYADYPLSADHLTNVLGCSLPALHKDVYALNNEKFPLNIFKTKGGYIVQFHSYASIDSLYAETLKTSLDFQVLKRLFFQRFDTIQENANYLNCSFSSFYSKLNPLNTLLEQWKIRLRNRPLRIAGNEELLRHFYYLFFKEHRFSFQDYGFSSTLVHLVDQYIRVLLVNNQVKNTMNVHFYLMHNFLICLHRRRRRYKLNIDQADTSCLQLPEKSEHSELILRIKMECRLIFNDNLSVEALWPLFSGNLVLTAQQQDSLQENNKNLARFYSQHIRLLKSINEASGNLLSENEIQEALRHLGNELFIYYPKKRPIQILSQQKKYSLLQLKKIYARPMNHLTTIIGKFLSRHRLPVFEETMDVYLYSLIVSIDNLLDRLSIQEKPLTVLLLSDTSPNQERFWRNILKNWIGKSLDYHYHSYPFITQQELTRLTKNYDLLITDVTMPELESKCPIILINSYPTLKDFRSIQQFIDNYDQSFLTKEGKVV